MGSQYLHLSRFERGRIFEWYHYEKRSIREIARRLSRSHSTISRELRRNKSYKYVPTYYPSEKRGQVCFIMLKVVGDQLGELQSL